MPRSTYLYVVTDINGNILAGFTVKYEMLLWFNRGANKWNYRVWRLRDGQTVSPVDITREFVEDNGEK